MQCSLKTIFNTLMAPDIAVRYRGWQKKQEKKNQEKKRKKQKKRSA